MKINRHNQVFRADWDKCAAFCCQVIGQLIKNGVMCTNIKMSILFLENEYMSKLKKNMKSLLIQIAFATGICIIIMTYFSKRVLPEPIGYLPMAIPPFLMSIHGAFYNRFRHNKIWTTWYWIAAIFCSTTLIIVLHY